MLHVYGRSPVWIFIWAYSVEAALKRFSHTRHAYGRSFECEFWWTLKLAGSLKVLLQTVHMKGSSPVCLRMCTLSEVLCRKHWPHTLHG
uniref:Putative secreted protein n=1 Tax=Ixodes ricinus TaxID=34613 RepID=A0A6B0U9U4_IXORI